MRNVGTVGVILVGPRGRVATALRSRLPGVETCGLELRLVGAVDRQLTVWDPDGLDPLAVEERLPASQPTDWDRILERCGDFGGPLIVVDCTASPEVAARRPHRRGAGDPNGPGVGRKNRIESPAHPRSATDRGFSAAAHLKSAATYGFSAATHGKFATESP